MKRIIFLAFSLALMWSCSLEDEPVIESAIDEIDLVTELDGCIIYSFEFGDAGHIEVRNFYDYLSIKISSTQDYSLKQLNLHFAETVGDFPLVNKKGLLPGRMDHKYRFDSNTYETTIEFPLDELPTTFLIAAYAKFDSPIGKYEAWAGDIPGEPGEWSYFEYATSDFLNYAGTDHVREITLSEATAIGSWDEVRKLFANMMDDGVDRTSGTYNPSIWDIIDDFNDPTRESQLGDYTTTYTLGTGECSDSVELTLRIVPD